MRKQFAFIIFIVLVFGISACDEKKAKPCGNGRLDPGEQCDPGILEQADNCTDDCRLKAFCGNGLLEEGEQCDDGNLVNGDGCSSECRVERGCGNGIIDWLIVEDRLFIEECDDGNLEDGDGCSSECRIEGTGPACGNGILEWPEQCDDGNLEDGDGCSSECKVESGCGNGVLDFWEQCDDGNRVHGDGCSAFCRIEFICGDGICDEENGEHCEVCPRDCCPRCGDGHLDADEECDDGNNIHFDGCSAGCNIEGLGPVCGNGVWEIGEQCDDGNLINGDGCSSTCQREFVVGDGVCDSQNGETCRLSPADCCPLCGNNTINAGEQCDGTALGGMTCLSMCYDGGTLGCTAWCELDFSQCLGTGPICGDGTAECAEECDGTDFKGKSCASFGYAEGNLTCTANCTIDIGGCSGFLYYLSADLDSGTDLPTGWTKAGSWNVGIPTTGPSTAHSPPNCLSTSLSGQYSNSMTYDGNHVRMPPIDLSAATNPVMTFQSWMDAESCCDGGRVEYSVNNGVTWTPIPAAAVSPAYTSTSDLRWSGILNSWATHTVQLSAFVGQELHLRFAFMSDGSITYQGWYIDNVLISEQ